MSESFTPRHLKAEQLGQLYASALAQAEANVASAWINFRLAQAALTALEAEAAAVSPPSLPPRPPEG
jgi:hypothetical protein